MRLFALAFVLGALALQSQSALPLAPAGAPGLAALLGVALCRPGSLLRAAVLLLAGALCGFGWAHYRAASSLAQALPFEWEGRDVALSGVVASLPSVNAKGTRFQFDVLEVLTPGAIVPPRIALTWYAPQRAGSGTPPPSLVAGERWQLVVRLKRPRGLANPHAFDFEAWALERGIRATGYVRARPEATRQAARVDGWPWTLHRWRGEIRDSMNNTLGESRWRGVLVALAIGDQDAIGAEDWKVFWRTGVGHLMSISGLHITMLAGLAYAVVAFAWVRLPGWALRLPARKAGVVAGLLAAVAYSLLAGYAVPAQRTCVMLATFAACVLLEHHASPSRVLALSALAVVGVDPWAVLSAGFWLSFGAVGAIFYGLALRTGNAGRFTRAAREQLAVTVAMFPLLLALFQEVSLVSPLANAIAIPVVSLGVVPLALAGAFFDGALLLQGAHALLAFAMPPLEYLAMLPGTMLESHAPPAWTVASALAGSAWLLAPRGFPLRAAGAIWIAPLFACLPPQPAPGEAWIDVLDVGHGLAVVARTQRHVVVYDAGPTWSAESDSGGRIVVPFLRGEGLRRLDGLVVSHADDDHYGGAASIATTRTPGWLLSSLPRDDALHGTVPTSLRCEAGQAWTWDGVRFEVLHPGSENYASARARKSNDTSCVLRIATLAASMLLTGDVETRAEAEIVARERRRLPADVLLVPHHGSRTSSTPGFLDAVSPRFAVLSVAHRDRFGHPHRDVMRRYAERGIPIFRTDSGGALRVKLPTQPGAVPVITGQQARRRYWSDRPLTCERGAAAC